MKPFAGSLNVMLTGACNLRCAYCFASGTMAQARSKLMDWDDLGRVVDYHLRWGLRSFKIVGGEPTLHPRFLDLLDLLAGEEQIEHLFVYTNLLCDVAVLDGLMALSADKEVELLVNLNPRSDIGQARYQATVDNLNHLKMNKVLGRSRASFAIGINVYRPDFDYSYALDLCRRLQCNLRYSYVTPLDFEGIALQDYYRTAAAFAVRLAEDAFEKHVYAYVDCNYVPVCCYTDEQYEVIRTKSSFTRIACDLPTPLSITPDMSVIPCFVVEELGALEFDPDTSPAEMAEALARQISAGIVPDLFDECQRCHLKRYRGTVCGCPGFRKRSAG
jgi:hypothetical protein